MKKELLNTFLTKLNNELFTKLILFFNSKKILTCNQAIISNLPEIILSINSKFKENNYELDITQFQNLILGIKEIFSFLQGNQRLLKEESYTKANSFFDILSSEEIATVLEEISSVNKLLDSSLVKELFMYEMNEK